MKKNKSIRQNNKRATFERIIKDLSTSYPNKAILEKIGYENYHEYLQSEHWNKFKIELYKRSAVTGREETVVCRFCLSRKNLVVHHKTYHSLGKEEFRHCVIICEKCHINVHKAHKDNRHIHLWLITNEIERLTRADLPLVVDIKSPHKKPKPPEQRAFKKLDKAYQELQEINKKILFHEQKFITRYKQLK